MSKVWPVITLVLSLSLAIQPSLVVSKWPKGVGEDGFSAEYNQEYQSVRRKSVQTADGSDNKNNRPLIGILTQPCHDCPGRSYIAAANVKWVEMAGGRPVPIRFYASDDELWRLFKSVNGLVFPGGLTWLWLDSPYVSAARKLFNWAVEANSNGEVFPIHGICLGHQLLHILVSNVSRNDLLVDTDSVEHATTLNFTSAARSSHFLEYLSDDLYQKLQDPSYNLALQNHMYGIPPAHYDRWPILKSFFNILSTTEDRKGLTYVSTVEAKNYPFTGTQWHPEKPPFEFGMQSVPHTVDAIQISQSLANHFIQTARKCPHKPASYDDELAMEIYSTPPVFSARFEVFDDDNYDGPDITYYFDDKEGPVTAKDKNMQQEEDPVTSKDKNMQQTSRPAPRLRKVITQPAV